MVFTSANDVTNQSDDFFFWSPNKLAARTHVVNTSSTHDQNILLNLTYELESLPTPALTLFTRCQRDNDSARAHVKSKRVYFVFQVQTQKIPLSFKILHGNGNDMLHSDVVMESSLHIISSERT